MSRPPSPPAARHRGHATPRALLAIVCGLLGSSLALTGCYQGPDIPSDAEAWEGQDDDDDGDDDDDSADEDDGDDDDGASGGASASSGDDDDPTDDDPTDDDPTGDDPTGDDPTGDDSSGDDPTGDDSSGDDSSGDDSSDDDPGPMGDEVPDNAYCTDVAGWDPSWSQLEVEILEIMNQRRAEGANCGSAGSFGPAPALTMNAELRCAARVHSKDMDTRSFFDHVNPSGEQPWDRMQQAGYNYSSAGENIAGGNSTAEATMQQWMDSDGHCGNIMSPNFTEVGVGYYPGGQWGYLWTQNFGRP